MDQEERLRTQSIPKLLWSLSLPAVCAQIITLVYSAADRMFIGRMENGALAMAGLGIALPIITVISSFTALLGRGGAPYAAICMGRSDLDEAEKYMGTAFTALVAVSLFLTAVVTLWCEPLCRLFGASEQSLPFATDYLRTYALGTVFVQVTVGMNYFITTQGFARTAMITTGLGGVLNMALDPLFIFTLGMGVRGAALATVIAQMISCVWVMAFLFGKKTRLRLRRFTIDPKILVKIMGLGFAPFFMTSTEGLLHLCFNRQLSHFGGDAAVGAMAVLFMLQQLVTLVTHGIAQGSQPIVSYNYGAKLYGRVRESLRLSFGFNVGFAVIGAMMMVAFPEAFIRFFNNDQELIAIGAPMLRVYILGTMVMGAHNTFQQAYTSMGEGKYAFAFAFCRKMVLLIPLIYLLPQLLPWGVMAVALAEPVSDGITTSINAFTYRRFLKRKLQGA